MPPELYRRYADIPQYVSESGYGADHDLDYLLEWLDSSRVREKLQLQPDFQRSIVWTTKQQSAYIEHLLKGGVTATTLYFNCPSWQRIQNPGGYDDFVLVDGLQRITSIRKFMTNELKVFGHRKNEFEDKRPRTHVRAVINTLKTKAEVLQWYLQINSMGKPHKKSELERVQRLLDSERKEA